jgi:hypothetical protein
MTEPVFDLNAVVTQPMTSAQVQALITLLQQLLTHLQSLKL